MSKSEGNFVTINELLETEKFGGRKWPGEVLRLAMLMTNYREPIDFSVRKLEEAENVRDRKRWALRCRRCREPNLTPRSRWRCALTPGWRSAVDDLNTPTLVQRSMPSRDARSWRSWPPNAQLRSCRSQSYWAVADDCRFSTSRRRFSCRDDGSDPEDAIDRRLALIRDKNWAEADRIRDELLAARHPVEGRQGPGHRRAHHDLGGQAVRDAQKGAGQRPPLSCRTSPPQGGRLAASTPRSSSDVEISVKQRPPISPLWGRCPAGQRGAT